MVAEGDHVSARGEDMVSRLGGNAVAVGGIFAVADHQIDLLLPLERGEMLAQKGAAGRTDHVADTHNSHNIIFLY